MNDFENDFTPALDRTDPSGNETMISPSYRTCQICKAHCSYLGHGKGTCWGETGMSQELVHLCQAHKKMLGSPEAYYESEPTDRDGPIQRMLGMQGDNVKELSNWGGEFKDEEDTGKDYSKDDPHYTEG